MLVDPEHNLTIVERNFTGNSHISTGMWLMNKNRDQSLWQLIEAHKVLVGLTEVDNFGRVTET